MKKSFWISKVIAVLIVSSIWLAYSNIWAQKISIKTIYTLMKGGEPSLTTDNRDSEMLRNLITVKGGN